MEQTHIQIPKIQINFINLQVFQVLLIVVLLMPLVQVLVLVGMEQIYSMETSFKQKFIFILDLQLP